MQKTKPINIKSHGIYLKLCFGIILNVFVTKEEKAVVTIMLIGEG